MFIVVCYDVPAKRTGIFKKLLKEYLVHEQNSVFMGDLPESEWLKLQAAVARKIAPEDRILAIVCENRHNATVQRLSKDPDGGPMRREDDEWHGKDWTVL